MREKLYKADEAILENLAGRLRAACAEAIDWAGEARFRIAISRALAELFPPELADTGRGPEVDLGEPVEWGGEAAPANGEAAPGAEGEIPMAPAAPAPEKPRRKRRTKAEMAAAESGAKPAARVDPLLDPADGVFVYWGSHGKNPIYAIRADSLRDALEYCNGQHPKGTPIIVRPAEGDIVARMKLPITADVRKSAAAPPPSPEPEPLFIPDSDREVAFCNRLVWISPDRYRAMVEVLEGLESEKGATA
jgi:hypothetical protein